MNNYFTLGHETPVYLYGAASIGRIVYKNNPNLNICGFIDKRADEIIEYMGLPVYTVSQAAEAIHEENAVIMLSLKNVFELEDIAVSLYEEGFDKLIFKTKAVLDGHGSIGEYRLSEVWDELIKGTYDICNEQLECFKNEVSYVFENHSIIQTQGDTVLAYIPVEMIHTNLITAECSDINIQGFYPNMYFFYYLSNHRNGQCEDYLNFVVKSAIAQEDIKITEAWKRNVLRNRTMVYEMMRAKLDIDPQFFHRNAPTAIWNDKGYFNLTSGKHRTTFLVSQGYRYIALSVSKEDYDKYLAYEDIDSICDKIRVNNLRYINKRIYHPLMYQFPCSEPLFYSSFQIELLCRAVRLSNTYGREVCIYMNLSKENSLYRILEKCRLISMLKLDDIEQADIVLIDKYEDNKEIKDRISNKTVYVWTIGTVCDGTTIAEYILPEGVVYLCETKR